MSDRRGKRKEKEKVVSKDATTNATMTWKSKNTMGGSGLTPPVLEELRAKGLVSQLLGVRKIEKLSKTPQGVVVHTCEREPPPPSEARLPMAGVDN